MDRLKECNFLSTGLKSNLQLAKRSTPSVTQSRESELSSPRMTKRNISNSHESGTLKVDELQSGAPNHMNGKEREIKRSQSSNTSKPRIMTRMQEIKYLKPISKYGNNIKMITSKEAETILKNSSKGTWILRMNEKREKRISFVKEKVVHMRLFETSDGLFSRYESLVDAKALDDLMHELQTSDIIKENFYRH